MSIGRFFTENNKTKKAHSYLATLSAINLKYPYTLMPAHPKGPEVCKICSLTISHMDILELSSNASIEQVVLREYRIFLRQMQHWTSAVQQDYLKLK
jgi:hypothetical protein